ncbi:hypothetical protein FK514_26790, partial [Klebsiella pneumoniae]|uniref:sigma-70 non-essential region-containing protein n=1 Tax=Klebsiella pneumoniae TaxID=573 RepID=UPI00210ABAE3
RAPVALTGYAIAMPRRNALWLRDASATHVGSELSQEEMDDDEDEDEDEDADDNSDDDNSIDPELAREKFAELRTQRYAVPGGAFQFGFINGNQVIKG